MPPICALCLGGPTDVPPFAAPRDARDFVAPCATCSFMAHRKCLLDWFQSVPAAKITRTYADDRTHADSPTPTDTAANGSLPSRWLGVQAFYARDDAPAVPEAMAVLLSTPCPQCKQPVVFRTRASPALAAAGFARAAVVDLVQYTTALMGVTGAASGLVTVAYVALARCGAAMWDALVPRALLGPLLARAPAPFSLARWAAPAPQSWDRYKQHLVVLFPVALYRARHLPGMGTGDARATATALLSEAWVCNYLSAVGGHRLARAVWANCRRAAAAAMRDPWRAARHFRPAQLAASIDWWDPHNMVAAMIPVRWLYGAVFRVTFNRWYFDLTVAARPRDVANCLSEPELEALQDASAAHAEARQKVACRWRARGSGVVAAAQRARDLVCDGSVWACAVSHAWLQYHKWRACVRHDFSGAFFSRGAVVTAVTTLVWPFVAADVGRVVYRLLLARSARDVPKDKLVLLSNLVGMVVVAVANDVARCYLSAQKARQMCDMAVVYAPRPASDPDSRPSDATPQVPGAYREGVVTRGRG